MADESKVLATLGEKIEKLIIKYHELEIQNEKLKREVEELQTQNDKKEARILKLEEELKGKSIETDELLGKIEAVLGI
jgi:cell division protein FtsB